MECSYEELRRDGEALEAVEDSLFHEQGGLCAYTGQSIRLETGPPRKASFHIEHLIPQAHCVYGQDADYKNLVACWPWPNCGFEPKYGAIKKGSWPSAEEGHLFVSPLNGSCTARFKFNRRGEISPQIPDDKAAEETIRKLGLDDKNLTELRRKAIQGALEPGSARLQLKEARRVLRHIEEDSAKLDRGEAVRLRPFSFVIQQALAREIKKLEAITAQT